MVFQMYFQHFNYSSACKSSIVYWLWHFAIITRFIVKQDNKTYIIDRKGNVIVDNIYNWIIPLKENNFLPVRLDDSHKGFIDRDKR